MKISVFNKDISNDEMLLRFQIILEFTELFLSNMCLLGLHLDCPLWEKYCYYRDF